MANNNPEANVHHSIRNLYINTGQSTFKLLTKQVDMLIKQVDMLIKQVDLPTRQVEV